MALFQKVIRPPYLTQGSAHGADYQTGEVFAHCPEINRFRKAGITPRFLDAFQFFKGSQARDGGNLHMR
jgi:hypothetical protein